MNAKWAVWIGIIGLNAYLLGPVELLLSAAVYAVVVVGLIVIHELGHAGFGLLTGNQVVAIQVGVHKPVFRWRIGYFRLVVRRVIMGGGSTILSTPYRSLYRTRRAVVLLAGIGAEIAALWAIYRLGWQDAMAGRLGFTALFVVIIDAAANLVPRRTEDDQMNDGAQLLALSQVSDEEIDSLIAAHGSFDLIVDYAEKAEDGEYHELAAIGAAAAARTPGSIDAHRSHALGLMHAGDFERSRRAMDEIIRRSNQIPDDKLWIIQNDVAYLYALIGDPELLEAADQLSQEALEAKDLPPVRGTRGAVMVQTGRAAEGLRLLEESRDDQAADLDRFETYRFLVLGHLAVGDPWSARDAHAAALELSVEPQRIVELEPRLGAAEAVHLVAQRRAAVELTDDEKRERARMASHLLSAWLDPAVTDERRAELFALQGGDPESLTDDDMAWLGELTRQPVGA